ncbi:MAG: hypothetical protein II350_10330, partial [Clostridia bacterium]|nr:hypothetical protein [Clostridia bacterium]
MKRFLLIALAMLMLVSGVAIPSFAKEETATTDKTQLEAAEKQEVGALPSSFTLIGSPDLPPVCNQGEVGCCASCAITYMQYTTAVSKYIRKYHPEIKFEPATGEKQYLFSPKWTFGFSGAGTAWVYHILQEQGAVTMDLSSFYLHPKNGSFLVHRTTGLKPLEASAVRWDIGKSEMQTAMNFRLKDFEQIWVGGNHTLAKVDGKLEMTTSEEGKELINKIKTSLNAGNVVVTGGLSGAWKYTDAKTGGKIVANGTLGKNGDQALMFSRGELVGGHQVSIIGYDDNIQCEYNGTVMTGAFQVINSWGEEWMNDGCIWLMYDALNERSEHEALNFEDRVLSMDQFCFIDWEEDIVEGLPEIFVEAEVSADNREKINLQPVVKNENNVENRFNPHMFEYSRYHPTYDELKSGDYFTIDGKKNGNEAKGTFTLDYYGLTTEETIKELSYGIRIMPRGGSVTLHALRLKNSRGQVIAEIDIKEGGEKVSASKTYYFGCELFKVTFNQEAEEGSSYESFSAYYNKGNKVPLDIKVNEGYNGDALKVTTDGGVELEKNGDGLFELSVEKDTVITYSGIAKGEGGNVSNDPTPDAPAVSPEGTPDSPSNEEEQSSGSVSVLGLLVGSAVTVAVVAVVAVAAVVAIVVVVVV